MKSIFRVSLVLLTLAMVSCEDLLVADKATQDPPAMTMEDISLLREEIGVSSSSQSTVTFPELIFKKNQKGKYRLIIKDKTIEEPDSSGTVKISLVSRKGGDDPIEEISFTFGGIERVMSIPMPAGSGGYTNQVVKVSISYSFSNGKEKAWNFHVWSFADGTTALQQPAFGGFHSGVQITVGDTNGDGHEDFKGEVVITNDPAFDVAAIKLSFNEPFGGPAPLVTSYLADCGTCPSRSTFQDRSYVFRVVFAPDQNPLGSTYNVTATMLNTKGEIVGQPLNSEVVVQKADFTGRIRRVRVRQEGDGSNEYKIIGTVEGDSKGEVASLDIKFKDVADLPMAIPAQAMATFKRVNEENGLARYEFSPLTFEGGVPPIGKAYTVQATMLNAEGMPLANPVTMEVTVERKATSVHNLYIRERKDENGSITHQLAGIVLNASESFDYVEITFGQPTQGPPLATILWRMRKKPEMVFQEWDNLINDYVTEIQNNPLYVGTEPEWNPLFENRSAVGYTYPVTASLFDINGKQIGKPQTFQIIVEGQVQSTTTLVSTQIVSYDKGATWQMIVKLKNPLVTTEYVEVEFIKPYEGPAPFENPVKLMPISKEADNVMVYSTPVKFDGNPLGFTYGANIYQFGSGTRTSAGQANNKAELL